MGDEISKQLDSLTGLHQIGIFLQNIPESMRKMKKRGHTPAILWIDFSGLRTYNSMYGFESGDLLLSGLASVLRDQYGIDNITRYNSDHFVVCTQTDHLEDNIYHVFDEALKLNHGNSRPVAVGIYVMNEDGISHSSAIDRAKLACDSLQEPAHSSFAYYNQEMLEKAKLNQYVLNNYQKAMDEGWIEVYYQPVVRTVTGRICGAEALCRWKDPKYGMISPGQFIPALEDEGLITELDMYIIEQVCRDGSELIKNEGDVVPVSVNLSRKDFHEADLVERIEKLSKQYNIPRELINIEITESAFVRHTERLSGYIRYFHQLGFQVWMDDFGTGYSTLGSLKDLDFDELKIDMSFLSTYTEKARRIIMSVVRMAKEIGIQSLAEGVETQEQYEFLKNIGCEKIQGYYFGKPMDKQTFRNFFSDGHIQTEPLRYRNYYDSLSRINFQTDEPLCIIEDDGVSLYLIFSNEAYRNVLRRDNIDDINKWIEEINADNNPAHAFHRQYADEQLRRLSGPQVITYPSGDHYMELTGKAVTHYENWYVYALNIRYIQLNSSSEDIKKAKYVHYLYYMCADIAVFDLKTDAMLGLKSVDSSQPIGFGGENVDLTSSIKGYTEKFIYAPDQERYREFFNPKVIKQQMQQEQGQDKTGLFRSRMPDGSYRWMVHVIMPIPTSDFNQYICMTLPVDIDNEFCRLVHSDDIDQISCEDDHSSQNDFAPALLWKNIEAYARDMFFWKDAERRFVGVSKSFLKYYGFDSEQDVIGKTDEDLKWHVEPEAFKNDELDVLKYGKSVFFASGKCIVRGQQRVILANKIPVYRNGRIIGLMGNFYDAENLNNLLNERFHSMSIDETTGLLNSSGITNAMNDYLEVLWTENAVITVFNIYIPEYIPFRDRYGEDAGNAMIKNVGEVLRNIFGRESSIGRITGSHFAILMQNLSQEELKLLETKIVDQISKLRKVDEWPCALTPEVHTAVLNQKNTSREEFLSRINQLLMSFGRQTDAER